jgi:hypothetical protein
MAQVQVPFSYVKQVRSPAQALLQGYQTGLQRQEGLRQAALAEEDRRFKMIDRERRMRSEDISAQQTLEDRQIAAEDRARRMASEDRQLAAEIAAQQQAAQFREQFSAFARNPNPSLQDYVALAAVAPESMVKPLGDAYDQLTDEAKMATNRQLAQAVSVLKYQDPQMAIDFFNDRMKAAIKAENNQEAQAAKTYRDLVAAGEQEAAVKQILAQAVMTPGLGPEFVKAIGSLEPEKKLKSTPDTWDRIGLVRKFFEDGSEEYRLKGEVIDPERAVSLITEEMERELKAGLDAKVNEAVAVGNVEVMQALGQDAIKGIKTINTNLDTLRSAEAELQRIIDSGEYEEANKSGLWGSLSRRALKAYDDNYIALQSVGANMALGLAQSLSGQMSDRDIELLFEGALPNLSPGRLMEKLKAQIAAQETALPILQRQAVFAATRPRDYIGYVRMFTGESEGASQAPAPRRRPLVISPEPGE